MFTHWSGLPLPCALLPPPSFTPTTASMPRSPLLTARFRVSVVELLSMSKPSSPDPFATLCFRRLWRSFSPTSNPSTRLSLDQVSADDVVGAADERMLDSEADARA